MRELAITFSASMAGWLTGIGAGNVGTFLLSLTIHDPRWAWNTMTAVDIVWSELIWTILVAVGMLPVCVLLVCPLVFHQMRKPVRWRPFKAFWIGGAGGVVAIALWLAVLTPINWSRLDDRAEAGLITVSAFLIGVVTGSLAASMARSYPAPPPMPGSIPPPLPRYDH